MFDECQRRFIPIVIKRSAYYGKINDSYKKDLEVDTRMMKRLQKWAFNTPYELVNTKKTQSVFIIPLLANNLEEAKSLLEKVMLRRYNPSNPCVQKWNEYKAPRQTPPEIIMRYYNECLEKIQACWGIDVTKEDVEKEIKNAKAAVALAKQLSTPIKEANDKLSDWQTIFKIREKFKKVNMVVIPASTARTEEDLQDKTIFEQAFSKNEIVKYNQEQYKVMETKTVKKVKTVVLQKISDNTQIKVPLVELLKEDNDTWKIKIGSKRVKNYVKFEYDGWRNIKNDFDIRWLPYECQIDDENKRSMPFIPELVSSKYRQIVKLMMDKDKEHINGIVYHKNYQVHYHLGKTLEAYGAKYVIPKNAQKGETYKDYYRPLIDNAKKKIIKKWALYQPPKNIERIQRIHPPHPQMTTKKKVKKKTYSRYLRICGRTRFIFMRINKRVERG